VIKSIAKAEQVTATVTEYVEDDTVTAGGTEYKYAYGNDNTDGTYELKTDYDLYLDAYGYVIYADGVEDETNYVYIYEFGTDSGLTSTSKVVAYGFFLDGTDDEITINKVDGDKVTGSNYASKTDDGQWYKYRLKEDGKYDLTSVANVGGEAVTTGKDITNYDDSVNIVYNDGASDKTLKGNASTVFVIREDDGDVKVYTGIKNVADITSTAGDTKVTIFTDGSTTYAKYVFVDLNDGKMSGGSNSSDVVFVVDLDKKGTDADDNEYYRYDAILNGEVKQVKFDDSLNVGYLYNEVEYDDNGYVTSCDPVVATDDDYFYDTVTNASVSQKSSTITIDGEGFYMASGAKIFVIDGDDVSTYTAKKLANEYEDGGLDARVTGVLNADGEYSYLYIYLV
jgi:hypothetical protein